MSKLARRLLIGVLCGTVFLSAAPPSYSDSSLEEAKQLLQKSLTVYEIDQEVARLTDQETVLAGQIEQAGESIQVKDGQVAETREHAGKVLRAYYMGERESIWMLLFSAKSFSDALVMYEYLTMIVDNDERTLTKYKTAFQELKDMKAELEARRTELVNVKAEFLKQRERAVALQQELDEQLKAAENAAALQAQIEDLNKEWREKGVPLFRAYLKAMSEAMKSMPEILSGEGSKKYIKGSLTSPVFEMSDQDLNAFFRSKNKLLQNMTVTFANGRFTAAGGENGVDVSIEGHYTVENDPTNRLQFHVDELKFNGFVLPDTTNRSLEQEFNLGFSPEAYLPLIQATDVITDAGLLTIKLKLKLK